jgi:hypothetical protein
MAPLARLIWAVGLGVVALAAGCLSAAPYGCSPDEAAAFNEIDHYAGITLQPQDSPFGVCFASFRTADPPEVVLDHYRAQWTAAGWSLNPPEPSAPPRPEGEDVIGVAAASATRDGMTYSVSAELIRGQESEYSLLAGADQ